jgi:hypothetical protein
MCHDPACDKELRQCEILAEAYSNGRCRYHEEITTGLSNVKGSLKALWWIMGLVGGAMLSMQSANLLLLIQHLTVK